MNNINERIYALQNTDPQELLIKHCRNLDDSLKRDVDKLYNEFIEIETGIINALLMFILKMKQGYLPHYNYLHDSLMKWLAHISTTEDALMLITRPKRAPKQPKKTQAVAEPDWINDYMKELAELKPA